MIDHPLSSAAEAILASVDPQNASHYLWMARSGLNSLNHYHNPNHELQVVYWSYAALINDPHAIQYGTEYRRDSKCMVLAALFHDHNHTGHTGVPDRDNILMATRFVRHNLPDHLNLRISKMIEATEFTGMVNGYPTWAREPEDIYEECLRDADLAMIYSEEGRKLLVGLADEMGTPWRHLDSDGFKEAWSRTEQFYHAAPMYTWYGQQLKARYLKDALQAFRYLVTNP